MPKTLILFALAAMTLALGANPITPRALSRIWFNDANELMAIFGEDSQIFIQHLPTMDISTNSGTWNFPSGFPFPTEVPWTVNLSQAIPGFTIDRQQDSFTLHDSLEWMHNWNENITWGPDCNSLTDLHALTPGQSAVQVFEETIYFDTYAVWAKDIGTEYTNYPNCSYELSVHVQDANGNPVANLPLYWAYSYYVNPNLTYTYTDTDGNWSMTTFAIRTRLIIKDPLDQSVVVDTLLYPEPLQPITINAVVSSVANDDPLASPVPGILSVRPNLLRNAQQSIYLKYEASTPLPAKSELRLYDLRGRLLASHEMPSSGQAEWNLPTLANGIYYIGLSSEGRQLARERLTVLK